MHNGDYSWEYVSLVAKHGVILFIFQEFIHTNTINAC